LTAGSVDCSDDFGRWWLWSNRDERLKWLLQLGFAGLGALWVLKR
jgi:hypothetical protein